LLHFPCLRIYKFANHPDLVTDFALNNLTNLPHHLWVIHTIHHILNSINNQAPFAISLNPIYFVPKSDLIAIRCNDSVFDF
jgi:hypothetical protein